MLTRCLCTTLSSTPAGPVHARGLTGPQASHAAATVAHNCPTAVQSSTPHPPAPADAPPTRGARISKLRPSTTAPAPATLTRSQDATAGYEYIVRRVSCRLRAHGSACIGPMSAPERRCACTSVSGAPRAASLRVGMPRRCRRASGLSAT
ncbi:hypothetical protein BC834DRAFT_898721 [Gloeopeniophorella convolvens]|nr:hypothetical protein BC834DRAFT_917303 [Gloeopeniophorella convolvens]KAI0260886.1 hypothetical protein BC834DRAFT_898721 [Gloeopeniophorella convolvens]